MAKKNKALQAVDDIFANVIASARPSKPKKARKKPKQKVITRKIYVDSVTKKRIAKPRKPRKPRKTTKRKTSKSKGG